METLFPGPPKPGVICWLMMLSSAVTPRAKEMSSVRSLTPVNGYNPSAVVTGRVRAEVNPPK